MEPLSTTMTSPSAPTAAIPARAASIDLGDRGLLVEAGDDHADAADAGGGVAGMLFSHDPLPRRAHSFRTCSAARILMSLISTLLGRLTPGRGRSSAPRDFVPVGTPRRLSSSLEERERERAERHEAAGRRVLERLLGQEQNLPAPGRLAPHQRVSISRRAGEFARRVRTPDARSMNRSGAAKPGWSQ